MAKVVNNGQNGLNLRKMAEDSQKWSKLAKMVKIGQNGQNWPKMVKNVNKLTNRHIGHLTNQIISLVLDQPLVNLSL